MNIKNSSDDKPDSDPGIQVRFAPHLIKAERRRTRRAALFGVFAALVVIADAVHAWLTGVMVDMGPAQGFLKLPPSLAGVMGLLLLAGALWILLGKSKQN